MPKLNEYLTVAQAAQIVGVSKDTLRRWDKAGKLKARRHPVTGYRLYLRTELEAFLAQVADEAGPTRGDLNTGSKRGDRQKRGG